MDEWHLYLVRTRLDTLYAGIAKDVARRIDEHASSGSRGSRYLRSKGPLTLVYHVRIGDRAQALKVEARIRKLPKHYKERIVAMNPDRSELLELLAINDAEDMTSMNNAGQVCSS